MSTLLRGATSRSVRKHRHEAALAAWSDTRKRGGKVGAPPEMAAGSPPPPRKAPLPKMRPSRGKRRRLTLARAALLVATLPLG